MVKFLDIGRINSRYADEIDEALRRVAHSGWYLRGGETAAFENDYADFIGARHCIGVGNGLDALWLIYRAYIEMGIMKPGDEVIVPANTYIASILAITENGLKPVLVEPDIETLQIDDSLIERAITERTRSVMIVHLYGRCAYTDLIGQLCKRHQLKLVEDNAQAHGCRYVEQGMQREKGGRLCEPLTGSLGDAAGHSFYPGKNLGALGDAGAVTTDDEQLAAVVRALANYGSTEKYVFDYRGRNSRIDELQAAVLRVKLHHLQADNRLRIEVAKRYTENITNHSVRLPRQMFDGSNVYHLFPIFAQQRDKMQTHLRNNGIETLIHYPIAPHRQRCYREMSNMQLPVTERIHLEELSLPMSPVLTEDEVTRVIEAVNSYADI